MPNIITSVRCFSSPLILILIFEKQYFLAIVVYILLGITDDLDGYIARHYHCQTSFGNYYDAIADFSVVFFTSIALILDDIITIWIVFVLIIMFLQYLITSYLFSIKQDKIGKYYGTIIFVGLGMALLTRNQLIGEMIFICLVIFSLMTVISRCLLIKNSL